MLLFKI